MARRHRRWLLIALYLVVPAFVLVASSWQPSGVPRVDPLLPAACERIIESVDADVEKALEAASALATSAEATLEEQRCGRFVADAIEGSDPTEEASPEAGASTEETAEDDEAKAAEERCGIAGVLDRFGASAAVHAVLDVAALEGDPACDAAPPRPEDEPVPTCYAVGRAWALAGAGAAGAMATAALDENEALDDDVACILLAQQAMEAARPSSDAPSAPEPDGSVVRAAVRSRIEPACLDAAAAVAAGRLDEGRRGYESILRQAPTTGDTAGSQPTVPASDGPTTTAVTPAGTPLPCAIGGLARVPARLAPDDWVFERGDRAVRWATARVPLFDDPLGLPEDDRGLVTVTASALTIGLVVLAVRQLVRWRRERVAGPVELKPDGDVAKPLADRTRHYLAKAGVLPASTTESVGEVLLDAVAVLGTEAKGGGPIASALAKLRSALEVKTGYTVTLTPDDDPAATSPKAAIVKVEDRSSGRLLRHTRVDAADERALAKAIAARVYLDISRVEEIEIRTAPTVRWSGVEGLAAYQEGQSSLEDGDHETAVSAFARAADAEPHHLGVQVALAAAKRQLAARSRRDGAQPRAVTAELGALLAAARAVTLDPGSIEAQGQLALAGGSVTHWHAGWPAFEHRKLVETLLGPSPSALGDPTGFRRRFCELGNAAWRRAARQAQRHRVWWRAWSLQHRRSVAGLVHPLSRKRASTFDALLANVVSAHYQARAQGWTTSAWADQWARVRLSRVRFGRLGGLRRPRAGEDTVLYNLAIAYTFRASALAEERARWRRRLVQAIAEANMATPVDGSLHRDAARVAAQLLSADPRLARQQDTASRLALRTLRRSTSVVGAPPGVDDIDDDPDLAGLRGTTEFRAWRMRFGAGADEAAKAGAAAERWVARLRELATRADSAAASCVVRRSVPVPSAPRSDQATAFLGDAVDWLGDDVVRWERAQAWASEPTAAARQSAFAASVSTAAVNRGRAIHRRVPRRPAGASVADVDQDGKRLWEEATRHVGSQPALARAALAAAEGKLAGRDVIGLATLVEQRAAASEAAWRSIAAATTAP